jgi:F-type H+-transporting ATPase subunit c
MGFPILDLFLAAVDPASGGVMGVNGVLALGVGLAVLGAAAGIGRLAASAVESMARQPEAGGRIFTSMIIAAALIEGFTFFALVICMLGLQQA